MDLLDSLLVGPRARGAFILRVVLDPPWSVRVEDRAPLSVVVVVRGQAWVVPDDGAPLLLPTGSVAVVRGPDPYTVADPPGTAPAVAVGPQEACTATADGRHLTEEWSLGVRTWGDGSGDGAVLLVGSYASVGEVSRPLLAALPPVLTLGPQEWDSPVAALLAAEVQRDAPGQGAVLDRLLDVTCIDALRTWFRHHPDRAPSWFRAAGDPVVGRAVRLLHHNPAHPWTVGGLAAAVGVSRAVLARRFAEQLGEPPMAHLTRWRLDLAADLLLDHGLTVEAVARRVGYGTAFALSAAFRRERGLSPREHRERAGGAEVAPA